MTERELLQRIDLNTRRVECATRFVCKVLISVARKFGIITENEKEHFVSEYKDII